MYNRCQCSTIPREHKFSDEQLTMFAERLKLLAVKARLQIVLVLADRPHCVCDICAHTGLSQSLVSHHIADLLAACFVGSNKDGKYVEYFLTANGRELLSVIEHISRCDDDASVRGGEKNMIHDEHNCDSGDDKDMKCCQGGKCCRDEATLADMSKEELLAKKSKVEQCLQVIIDALAKK